MKRRCIYICALVLSIAFASCAVEEPLGWTVNGNTCVVEDLGSSQGTSITIDLNNVDAEEDVIQSFRESQKKCVASHVKAASYQNCEWQWGTNDSFSQKISDLKEVVELELSSEILDQLESEKAKEQQACFDGSAFCRQEGVNCITSAEDFVKLKDIMGNTSSSSKCGAASQRHSVYIWNDITLTANNIQNMKEAGITSLYNLNILSPSGEKPTITFEDVGETLFESINNVQLNNINIVVNYNIKNSDKSEETPVRFAKELNCSDINSSSFEATQTNAALFESVDRSYIISSKFNVTATGQNVKGLVADRMLKEVSITDVSVSGTLKNTGVSDCSAVHKTLGEDGKVTVTHDDSGYNNDKSNAAGIGALAGHISQSLIHNAGLNSVTVDAPEQCVVGGLIGYAEDVQLTYDNSSFEDSANEVLGKDWVGGRIGYMNGGSVQTVVAKSDERHSVETKRVQGHYDVGGFVGYVSRDASVADIKNNVSVVNGDKENIGGFVGHTFGAIEKITNVVGTVNKWDEPSYWTGTYKLDCSDAPHIFKLDPNDENKCLHILKEETVGTSIYNVNHVGGFAGMLDGQGRIDNIHNTVNSMTGWYGVGGVAGYLSQNASLNEIANHVKGLISGREAVGGVVGNNDGRVYRINNNTQSVQGKADIGGAVGLNTNTGSISEVMNATESVACSMLCGGCIGESDGTVDTIKSSVTSVVANAYAGGFTAGASSTTSNIYSVVDSVKGVKCATYSNNAYGLEDICCELNGNTICRSTCLDGGQKENSTGLIRLWNLCTNEDGTQNSAFSCELAGFAAVGDSSVYGPSLTNIVAHFGEVRGDYDLGGFLAYQSYLTKWALPRNTLYENIAVSGNIVRTSELRPNNTSGLVGSFRDIDARSFESLVSLNIHLVSSMVRIVDSKGNTVTEPTLMGAAVFNVSPTDIETFVSNMLNYAVYVMSENPIIYSACDSSKCTVVSNWANKSSQATKAIQLINSTTTDELYNGYANTLNKFNVSGASVLRPVTWVVGKDEQCAPYSKCLTFDSVTEKLNVPAL